MIGRPLNSKIEKDLSNITSNRLQRWDRIQQMQQKFWQQWYDDIIIHQQMFPKSFQKKHLYNLNELVLIKEPNLPPMKWQMGRIIKLFVGKDNIVRNVQLKTASGIKERHVKYLIRLPIEE